MKRRLTFFVVTCCALFLISGTIDLNDLFDYENQGIPNYITKDNTPNGNPITNGGATLGRVLFYDQNLSVNNTISCASCHKQELAFGDDAVVSLGWNGVGTGRHSPRLVNARFGEEENFFWDERASSLEEQSTMPIHDHIEMGFSGQNGNPDIDSLINKLEGIDYYQALFTFVYGDGDITESEIQDALAQFVRSIQSFDSKFDAGRAQVNNNNANFPNFTAQENLGKTLFMQNANNGGANCNTCHSAPEFDIDSNSDNNSVITVAGNAGGVDVTNTRSPTLRDMFDANGVLHGPLMHDGSFTTMLDVIDLYDDIDVAQNNTNLDNRLRGGNGGNGQNLNLTVVEKEALVAFLKTLTGVEVYTAEQWSNPFDNNGSLAILNSPLPVALVRFQVSEEFGNVWLTWQTASEHNNRGFEIQHSSNAIDWKKIDFVEGAGDDNSTNDYSFLHSTPLAGINYYRLKQVDFDGATAFSNTLSQWIDQDVFQFSVYPNPVQDYLRVDLPEGSFVGSIMDASGRIVNELTITNGTTIDFTQLDAGVYFVRIEDKLGQQVIQKVIRL